MADDNGQKKTYVLAADGMRVEGRRYRRGDEVELPAEQGDRLVESGSLVESKDDLPDRPGDVAAAGATAGQHPVADEASTLYAAQTVDDEGEIKPSSFGHPDQVKAAEERQREQDEKADATKPAGRRRTGAATSTGETGGDKTARTAQR
jgi:hypothetical protein